ncbi:unnamed protein product, partial [Closterium sp. NIES-54]
MAVRLTLSGRSNGPTGDRRSRISELLEAEPRTTGSADDKTATSAQPPPTVPPPFHHRHDTRFQALRRLEHEEQERVEQERQELQRSDQQQQQTPQPPPLQQQFPPMSGLPALGLPSSPPVHSQSPTAYGPTRCPPRARPSSPLADLRTVLFRSPPRRSPPVSVLLSPPESSLTVSSHPITDYYRAALPVDSRVLASLVTDPRASPSSVSALTADVTYFASTRRLDYTTRVVAAPPPRPLSVGGESALGCDVLEDRQFELEFLAADSPSLCAMLLSLEGDQRLARTPPGSPPVFKACYVARGFSQHEGVDFFHTFAPTPKMTTLRVLLHVAAQQDYELHSLDFFVAFLQGRLHEEIWLRRPPGFTDTFLPGTQWSLRRPLYGLHQSPREWHDTLRSTLRDLGLRPSSADPSLFVRTGSTPFFILVYLDDLIFATADRAALTE